METTPPTVSGVTPANGATSVGTGTNVTATFSEAMDAATINTNTFELRNPANNLVAATVTYDAGTQTVTLDPTANLAASTTYTATIRGGAADPRLKDQSGNALATNFAWSFTTGAGPSCPCSIWSDTTLPSRQDTDSSAIEVGVKFRADTNGYILGLRFYKYATNTGICGQLGTPVTRLEVRFTKIRLRVAAGGFASRWRFPNTTYVLGPYTVGRYAGIDFLANSSGERPVNGPQEWGRWT